MNWKKETLNNLKMKNLYLVRHAKSSWNNAQLRDFDRPLNNRGKRDAPFMGKLMKEKGIKPDLIFSSPAKRAYNTAEYFADELIYSKEKIIKDNNLYEASVTDILKVLLIVEDGIETLMLFGHNPGLTDFSNFISDKQIENIPTTAVVSLILQVKRWKELDANTCTFNFFEYPKKYFN